MTVFQSVSDENSGLEELEARRQRAQTYQQTATPQVASSLGQYSRVYPWMSAGTSLALAQANVPVDHPVAVAAAQSEAKRKTKRHKGLGWHSLGEVVSLGAKVAAPAGDFLSGFGDVLSRDFVDPAKAVSRAAFTVLATPLQEAQNQLRALEYAAGGTGTPTLLEGGPGEFLSRLKYAEGANRAGSSVGREALFQLVHGDAPDLGSGFFPGGETEKLAKKHGPKLKDEHGNTITVGRVMTSRVAEPGTVPYKVVSGLIDGGIAWYGDPAAAAGRVASKVREANRTFNAADGLAGLISGTRNTTLPERVATWLDSEPGAQVIDKVAEHVRSGDYIGLREATGKKIPEDVMVALMNSDGTATGVRSVLEPILGIEVRDKILFNPPTSAAWRKATNDLRMFQGMPGTHLDINDIDKSVEDADRYLRNAKVSHETRNEAVKAWAQASATGDRESQYQAAKSIFRAVADSVTEHTGDRSMARTLTTAWEHAIDDTRAYFVDAIGNNVEVPGVVVGGAVTAAPEPHLYAEMLANNIPLPHAREIRRATSELRTLVDNGVFTTSTDALEHMQNFWKRAVLSRMAVFPRVVGEEQLRMAGSGLHSLFSHPLSYMAWRVGRKGAADVMGDPLDEAEQFAEALNHGWAGAMGRNEVVVPGFRRFAKDAGDGFPENGFVRAWADELAMLHSDPIGQRVADARVSIDDLKDDFWDGPLQAVRKKMLPDKPGLADRATSDAYVDSVLERLRIKTGGDETLVDMVATGKIAGKEALHDGERMRQPTKQFTSWLEDNLDVAPDVVKGQMRLTAPNGRGNFYDNATSWLWSHLYTERSNNLSRSPTFKQYYWQRVREMLPGMTEDAQTQVLRQAEQAGFKGDELGALRRAAKSSTGVVDVGRADLVAKTWALNQTKNLLYDLHERGQFFDAMRLVFPFGEAWKEVITRWARIAAERPQVARRFQQTIDGARGSGFFHVDPNGDEVFTYPGSEWITDKMLGVPVPLTGRVAGLSLMTDVMPGVGPVVQIPAAYLLPATPSTDAVRKLIFPFQSPDVGTGVLESFAPAWVQKFLAAIGKGDQRLFANTTTQLMKYLASTGDYDTSTVEGMQQLADDAKSAAQTLYVIRMAGQFAAPTAPAPEFKVRSPGPTGTFDGLLTPGDIDLGARPQVRNKDGSISTVRSITITEDHKAILIPTVSDNGKILSNEDAVALYKATGRHLGIFDTEAHADAYAQALHKQQAAYYSGGGLVTTQILANDFFNMERNKDIGYDGAVQAFLDKYGIDNFVTMQSMSRTLSINPPTTAKGSEWVRKNPGIKRRYPHVYGLFAPDSGAETDPEDFNSEAYQAQLKSGERQALKPEQVLRLANSRVASMIYQQAQTKVGPSPNAAQRDLLRQLKQALIVKYPGYQDPSGLLEKADTPTLIRELETASSDKRLSGTPTGKAVRVYLAARSKAQTAAEAGGLTSFASAASAVSLRDWLRQIGSALVAAEPSFGPAWEQVFSRELADDNTQEGVTN